jgi:hypothetical protein
VDQRRATVADHDPRVGQQVLNLARAETIGGQLVWRPAMPVTQLAARK